VTIRATSTVNGATDDLTFHFVFGTMAVSPAASISIAKCRKRFRDNQWLRLLQREMEYSERSWFDRPGNGCL